MVEVVSLGTGRSPSGDCRLYAEDACWMFLPHDPFPLLEAEAVEEAACGVIYGYTRSSCLF